MMTIAAFYVSGSSYLLTGSCNIRGNHNDVAVLWGPVMAISVLTAGIQSATCLYCTRIFLRAVFEDRPPTESSSLPQHARSGHSRTTGASARQAYRRMVRVMQLQWRSILFVLVLISDVILFAAIFIAQDSKTAAAKANPQLVQSWLLCLITHAGDKNACLDRTGAIAVKSSAIATEYFMIGITGWWTLALLGRGSMFSGWCDVIKSLWGVCTGCFSRRNQKDERISYVTSPTGRKHEVLHSSSSKRTGATVIKEGSESTIHTPTTAGFSPPMVQRSSPKPHQGSDVSPPTSTGEGEHDPPSDPEKGAVAARKSLRHDKPRYVAPQQSSARSNGSSDRLHPSVLAAYNQRPLPDPPQEADEPEPERERREYESLPEALVVHEAPAYTSRAGTPMARREELEMGERHEVPTSANSYSRTEPPWGRREVGPGEVDGSRRYAEGERVRYM